MQTHSSSVVAIKAAKALRAITDREYHTVEEFLQNLERNSNALRRANPSHASLQTTQREIYRAVENADPESVTAAKARTRDVIEQVVDRVESAKQHAAERAVSLLEDTDTVLTHDFSSTVLETFDLAVEQGASFDVYVTEARPRFLGRKFARTLADYDAIDATLIVDSASGQILSKCDQVLLGMSCIVDGTLYNRVGTYPLAATAAEIGVPVRVVGAGAKIVDSAFAFENEQRSVSEVMREPADGFAIDNPAYDATPTRLLDRVVTDQETIEY